jgi:hypothetical protein
MKVRELLEKLAAHPADAEVAIVDADTGWLLRLERVDWENCPASEYRGERRANTVFLAGDYGGTLDD